MRQASSNKEHLLRLKLKKEDPVELPMDDKFYEGMHSKIMQAIDAIDIKPSTKWAKAHIFLERRSTLIKM
ncbi:MAG: hypothetical protein WA160_11185 [Pseudobdellovibrio sp.]